MAKLHFETYRDLETATVAVMKAIGIQSRTGANKAENRMSYFLRQPSEYLIEDHGFTFDVTTFKSNLNQVQYALKYGLQTGRFHASAVQMLDSMTTYQYHKYCVKLAFYGATIADIVGYINGKTSLQVPVTSFK